MDFGGEQGDQLMKEEVDRYSNFKLVYSRDESTTARLSDF